MMTPFKDISEHATFYDADENEWRKADGPWAVRVRDGAVLPLRPDAMFRVSEGPGLSTLEEIERAATLIAQDATFEGPASAAEAIAEWERRLAAEAEKGEQARNTLTITGKIVLKMVSSGNGYYFDASRIVTVDMLKQMPEQVFDRVIAAELRQAIKSTAIKKLCGHSGIDPTKFYDMLNEARIAAAKNLSLRDFLADSPDRGSHLT